MIPGLWGPHSASLVPVLLSFAFHPNPHTWPPPPSASCSPFFTPRGARKGLKMAAHDAADDWLPLVDFSSMSEEEAARKVVSGLQGSGFLYVKCQETLPGTYLDTVRQRLSDIFQPGGEVGAKFAAVVQKHAKDPKSHCMLEGGLAKYRGGEQADEVIVDYWQRLDALKVRVLEALARGLGLEKDHLSKRHVKGNDSLRLLHYPAQPGAGDGGLRCKEHSDYGTITLLLTDECKGLQVLREGAGWCDVPYKEGALVVNAGSLLKDWTGGAVKATLHRVVAPAEYVGRHRYSAALFVDPDEDVTLTDQGDADVRGMSVAEYIKWRSGEGDSVPFAAGEGQRAEGI
uniref:Fe2OG dioxygenase domain-containing protein n=2 Tax=Hemiselmis andersenii TaxID=464988 RepID=A0A6U2F670_HEMAN|mmetsp:Transcript_30344/g.70867  ORF Transcript_30344/g.70867 Transcript_30344/m.70867 type:complete len:344 (+) Transcript_30344:183-1214(+)